MRARRPDLDRISPDAQDVLDRYGVPGCSVAVREAGEVVLDQGLGTSRAATGERLTSTTRLQACSMSKPVAVVGAMRLIEQGLLDLDADVSDYLTRWAVPPSGDWRPRLTLRQLASHTAGLTAHPGFPGYRRGERVPTLVESLGGQHPANAPGVRVDMVPGLRFRYSGAGTSLLQLVLEEVTATRADELLAELVLEPLGMHDSTFAQDLDDPERAHGHLAGSRPVPGGWRVQPEECAAGLWTTAADYLRFLDGVQRAYAGEAGAILAPATARELLTPVVALPSGPDLTRMTHVGLGFFVAVRDDGPAWFGHTGSNVGFRCAAVAGLRGRHGAVVMTNGDDGTPVVTSVLRAVATVLGWDDVVPEEGPAAEGVTVLADRAGTYCSDDGLVVTLADDDGRVVLTVPHQPPVTLRREGATTLTTDHLDLRVLLADDGSITVEQGGHPITLHRAS
ncbi:serine hydrolase domain-containing protein [Nocardioides sp. SYSU D00038]|uniref:serine hydrolase domain-containing protein n=1 Tax=Nocardioides sp. SYSU D00038 TaxID=2812554 RepID=UPI0027DAEF9A|nr:serine hydrolase domain-containing protein [Nocardioides sp. SYSU D00038]